MVEKRHISDSAPPKGKDDPSTRGTRKGLRAYRPPTIEQLGDMRTVTRKSGTLPDAKQLTKPGKGGG